jgi:hypothetical protein
MKTATKKVTRRARYTSDKGHGIGGYRVTIYEGRQIVATAHFGVPLRNGFRGYSQALDAAYTDARRFAATYGVN